MCSIPFVKGLEHNIKPAFANRNEYVPDMDCEPFLQSKCIGKTEILNGKNGTIDYDHQHAVQGYVVTGLGLMGCAEQGSENPVVSKGGGYGTPVPPTLLDVRKCRKTLETQKNARLYSTKMEVYLRESPKKGPPLRFWTSGSVERRGVLYPPPFDARLLSALHRGCP